MAGRERGQRVAGPVKAELTYIYLTQNNVYYASNHNQGVEHVPGISKIALNKVERVLGKLQEKQVFTLTLKFISAYATNLKHTATLAGYLS